MSSIRVPNGTQAVALTALFVPAQAAAQDLDNGRRLAQRWYAECHAIDSAPRKFRRAMPFAAMAARDIATTEMLTAYLLLPHAAMPNFPLSRKDAGDLAALIMKMKE